MKTAISVPDPIFEQVEHHAKRLGMSRSEFFATAAQRYVDSLDHGDLVASIDAALADAGDEDTSFVRRAASTMFARDMSGSAG